MWYFFFEKFFQFLSSSSAFPIKLSLFSIAQRRINFDFKNFKRSPIFCGWNFSGIMFAESAFNIGRMPNISSFVLQTLQDVEIKHKNYEYEAGRLAKQTSLVFL